MPAPWPVTTAAGTLILVTHDLRLRDGVGIDRTVEVSDGTVRERRWTRPGAWSGR